MMKPLSSIAKAPKVGTVDPLPPRFQSLSAADMESPRFLQLLREAAGQSDNQLRRVIADHLPRMTVIGLVADDLLAFAAYREAGAHVELEYIAVAADRRSRGYGRGLIRNIQRLHDGAGVAAETDDDAVEFYRRLGFRVSNCDRDPRWPDRRRYRCVLASGGSLR